MVVCLKFISYKYLAIWNRFGLKLQDTFSMHILFYIHTTW
jgi:hypothetical protein